MFGIQCKDKFWIKNPKELVCSASLLPYNTDSKAGKMNALTRLVLIITLILYLGGYKQAPMFGMLSLVLIVVGYFMTQKDATVEGFEICDGSKGPTRCKPIPSTMGVSDRLCGSTSGDTSRRFCGDCRVVTPNQSFTSSNERLHGPPNPKTLTAPMIAPPIAAEEYWRTNDLVVPSGINRETNTDLYGSGYRTVDDMGGPKIKVTAYDTPTYSVEKYSNSTCRKCHRNPCTCITPCRRCHMDQCVCAPVCAEEKYPSFPGDVLTACNYNPALERANLPVNAMAGRCRQNPKLDEINDNLRTQTLQPGAYIKAEVLEPVNSNIGISFTQQFQPVEVSRRGGDTMFTTKDPRQVCPDDTYTMNTDPMRQDVYDPRGTGYGTSYRSYVDPLLGQTRYYYDDVNAVRQGNFLIRSEVDHLPSSAQGMGPMRSDLVQRAEQDNSRYLAQKGFLDRSLQHRLDLQERKMRKYNNTIGYQRRLAPIHKGYGGMRTC